MLGLCKNCLLSSIHVLVLLVEAEPMSTDLKVIIPVVRISFVTIYQGWPLIQIAKKWFGCPGMAAGI